MRTTPPPPPLSSSVTVRIGHDTITIETSNPDLMRVKLAELAAVVAGGIEAGAPRSHNNDWSDEDTIERALHIATQIVMAVRP